MNSGLPPKAGSVLDRGCSSVQARLIQTRHRLENLFPTDCPWFVAVGDSQGWLKHCTWPYVINHYIFVSLTFRCRVIQEASIYILIYSKIECIKKWIYSIENVWKTPRWRTVLLSSGILSLLQITVLEFMTNLNAIALSCRYSQILITDDDVTGV